MASESSYSVAGVIAINTVLLGAVDADGRRGLSVQVSSLGTSGVLKVQQSNDNNVWVDTIVQSLAGTPSSTISAAGMYWCSLVGRYYRVLLSTATTAGTTTLTTRLDKSAFAELPSGVIVSSLPATPTGTNLIGKSICDISATAANGPAFSVNRLLSAAATTNSTLVKGSAGRVARIRGYNAKAAVAFLKLYNKATAPTVGTDTPVLTFALAASKEFDIDFNDFGYSFSTGIGFGITGAVADADTTALVAGDVLGLNILYI